MTLGSGVDAGGYTRTGVVNNGNIWKQRLTISGKPVILTAFDGVNRVTVAEEGPVNENRLVAGVLDPGAVSARLPGGTGTTTCVGIWIRMGMGGSMFDGLDRLTAFTEGYCYYAHGIRAVLQRVGLSPLVAPGRSWNGFGSTPVLG